MIVEISIFLSIGIFIGISQSAGIGGGTIINVILIIGLGYNIKESVIIGYVFLMGGGLASSLASLRKKSLQGKTLIDHDLILITLPMMFSGTIFGTILNHFISELVISILFIVTMLYMSYITYLKFYDVNSMDQRLQPIQPQLEGSPQQIEKLQEILEEENSRFPISKFIAILQIYVYTIIILLLKGGQTNDSIIDLPKCSYWSWILSFLHLLISLLYSKFISDKKIRIDRQKQSLGYIFYNENDKMSVTKLKQGIFNGFSAGLVGGCIGIGGGMILLPLWFRAGIDKNKAASSTGPLIFFSSSVSFFISAMSNKYSSVWLIVAFFFTGFIGSYVIKSLMLHLIEKFRLKYLAIILLLLMIIVSFAVFVPLQINKYGQNTAEFMSFDTLC